MEKLSPRTTEWVARLTGRKCREVSKGIRDLMRDYELSPLDAALLLLALLDCFVEHPLDRVVTH